LIFAYGIFLCGLTIIVYQDLKERMIDWYIFPLVGLLGLYINYREHPFSVFYDTVINCFIVAIILGILYLYTKVVLKVSFSAAFALGDVFILGILAISFSSLYFLVVLPFSIIASFLLHFFLRKSNKETVPLAGYIAIFTVIFTLGKLVIPTIEQ
jgi:hypothetical protein